MGEQNTTRAGNSLKSLSLDEVIRQLTNERQLRAATEESLRDVRRSHARLVAASHTRTHYVLLVPKPKWDVINAMLGRWVRACGSGLAAAYAFLRELLWPPAEHPSD
jgi:hypothetical protein